MPGEAEPGENPLDELARLAETAGAEVAGRLIQRIDNPHPGTYIGRGKVQELKSLAGSLGVGTVVFDNDLAPAQLRNIERETGLKIVDRTELILGIFAARARSGAAKLQVELAQAEYLMPRLRRMWTHLERQTGGIGVRGGPGERQLEVDRRQVKRRIKALRDEIAEHERHSERTVARRADSYNVSIIGYTNAGKSTLLNALTGADAFVEDLLFATLETKTKRLKLEGGYKVLISDTVGFIRRLPHDLIASFRATLEEARNANLLLHVVDAAGAVINAEMRAVEEVLLELGIADTDRLVVFNKTDLVRDRAEVGGLLARRPGSVAISAVTGEGLGELRRAIAEHAARNSAQVVLSIHASDGRALSYIAQHGFEQNRAYDGDFIRIEAMMPRGALAHLLGEYPSVKQVTA
jgi:GTP-binding protein HflX